MPPYGPCNIFEEQHNAFHTLVRTIIAQQVTKKAEKTYLGRIENIVQSPVFEPTAFPKGLFDELRGAKISPRKAKCILDLAERITTGELDLDKLALQDDDTVVKTLKSIKGIGDWTTTIFLIFYLHRLDYLPPKDIALENTVKDLYPGKSIDEVAEQWRPYRSIASWYIWRHGDTRSGVRTSKAA